MAKEPSATSIDDYIAAFPPGTRAALNDVRTQIRSSAPEATESISYAIPTFDLNGRHLVHFAGYEHHVGLYPGGSGIEAFRDELGAYRTAKGSVQFPLDQPMPVALIGRIVEFRVEENRRRAAR